MLTNPVKLKFCPRCENTKPLTDFAIRKINKDGHSYCCKKCHSDQVAAYKRRHPERIKNRKIELRVQNLKKIADFAERFGRYPITQKLLTEIFSKIKISTDLFYQGTACWEWQGSINRGGYGSKSYFGKDHNAHRLIYQLFVEALPDSLECDHLCRVRHCVNPIHIEPVPPQINVLRGESFAAVNAKKTHCPKGHPFAGDNLKIGLGRRDCRRCLRDYHRDYQQGYRQRKLDQKLSYIN